MAQIILKEITANVVSYTFLQEMLINIKARHFHSSINTENSFFTEQLSLTTFVL